MLLQDILATIRKGGLAPVNPSNRVVNAVKSFLRKNEVPMGTKARDIPAKQ